MSFGRLRIDLNAVAFNYARFVAHTRGKTGAVIKANAYGLGAEAVAQRLSEAGCRHFFVATFEEAAQLTLGGDATTYVFTPPNSPAGLAQIAETDFIPVLNTIEQASTWRNVSSKAAALNVDTGMQRLGIAPTEIGAVPLPSTRICLLMTHLACADTPEHPANRRQLDSFALARRHFPHVLTSIGNSAGTLSGVEFQGDLTRPGIGLYGGNPFAERPNPMQPVAICEGEILQLRQLASGAAVGYGGTATTKRETILGIVGIGYADGISRSLSNRGYVSLHGKRHPIVGRVSMDLVHVDLTDAAQVAEGDFVEFFGRDVAIDEVAALAGTLSYELLTSLGARLSRQYI